MFHVEVLLNADDLHQLAFILEVRSWLSLSVEMYDPLFNTLDASTVTHFGLTVLDHNEGCKRVLRRPTFVYMPHCEVNHWGIDVSCSNKHSLLSLMN